MKKNFLKLFLLTISFLLFNTSAQAAVTCGYEDYSIKLSGNTWKDVYYQEKSIIKDYSSITIDFESVSYLSEITTKKDCPEIIYVVDIPASSAIYITDDFNTAVNSGYTSIHKYEYTDASKVKCGNIEKIPKKVPELTSFAITVIQVVVPVILVLMGAIDFFKSITSGKEDEMKKGQKMFVKRLIVGIIIFMVVVIVKFFISIVADTNVSNMVDCIDCFISNDCN